MIKNYFKMKTKDCLKFYHSEQINCNEPREKMTYGLGKNLTNPSDEDTTLIASSTNNSEIFSETLL